MNILVRLSTHVYAEEKLEDDIYLDEALPDTIETCGIHGPEVVVPLRRNNHREIVFNYDKKNKVLYMISKKCSPIIRHKVQINYRDFF